MRSLYLLNFCLAGSCLAWSQTPGGEARALLNQGDDAMMQRKWHEAEIAFQKAAEADPASVEAHSKLANALALQMSPGPITSSVNRPLLARVVAEQQYAADLAPQNAQILSQLARTQDASARLSQDADEQSKNHKLAVQNIQRAIQLTPNDPDLRFNLANMELFAAGRAISLARHDAPDQMFNSRVRDPNLRRSLNSQYGPTLNDVIAQSEKVVQLQPDNGFGVLQTALGYVVRASLADSDAEFARDRELANQWETRFQTQGGTKVSPEFERSIVAGLLNSQVSIRTDPTIGGLLGGILGGAAGVPPPPPPPPRATSTNGAIRVGGTVAEANLIKRVQPEYPVAAKSARVQGTVEFQAVIDKTGHVRQVQLVRGHPMLVETARNAVLQWEYRPTLLNGNPIEIVTSMIVKFALDDVPPADSTPPK